MKITMLGTAAIAYPLVFCNCDNCKQARIIKGKSIRKRASVLINDDLMIDIGPDTVTAMNMYNKDMGRIKYLLQTHIHADHYDEELLCARIPYMAPKNLNKLHIYADPKCLKIMSERINNYENADLISFEGKKKLCVECFNINSGDIVEFDNYKVKAIESTHDLKHGSLLYIIEERGKVLFYATDTPALTDNALTQLTGIKCDAIIMDHTFGDVEYSFSHLNQKLFIEQINKLKEIGCIDDSTIIYGTHISHEGCGTHEILEENAKKNGYHIAYDGMELEI